jgi:ABC-type sugar transport system ATPase subunit
VTTVTLRDVDVERAGALVLHGVDLDAPSGQRLVLLGPSGAGKTTVLRAIAGLDPLLGGAIELDGDRIDRRPTRDRDVSMVNQDASLLPHLDVHDNVGFPLRLRDLARDEVERRVDAEVRAWSLRGLVHRRPRTLSAGERHEVALARALVRRPRVLLLDEPLARIDRPRVAELLRELIRVQEGYGVTLIACTNDQRVAMTLAHRIAVLRAGRVEQVGTPMHVYTEPATAFVAGFLGEPAMNVLAGRVRRTSAGARIEAGPVSLPSFALAVRDLVGHEVLVGIRPEHLTRPDHAERLTIEEPVVRSVRLGDRVEVELGTPHSGTVLAVVAPPAPPIGSLLRLAVDPSQVHLFDARSGTVLVHGV